MSTWNEMCRNNPVRCTEPVLVVGGVDGADTFHRRIHGAWRSTVRVERAKAVRLGRRPCGVCYRSEAPR